MKQGVVLVVGPEGVDVVALPRPARGILAVRVQEKVSAENVRSAVADLLRDDRFDTDLPADTSSVDQ